MSRSRLGLEAERLGSRLGLGHEGLVSIPGSLTGSLFRGIIPEKYRYFSGNFRKNSAGNFRKFPNSQS